MLYFLKNEIKQNYWQYDFEDNLALGLAYNKVLVGEVGKLGLRDLKQSDYVFVMHHDDLNDIEVRSTKAKIIAHQHGTAVNPFTPSTDRLMELEQFRNAIDVTTFHSNTAKFLTQERYPFIIGKGFTIGTPKDFSKYEAYAKVTKKQKIVVAGDMWPHKQPYLSLYLLKDLMGEYEIVFSFLVKEYDGPAGHMDWIKYYDLERWISMGVQVHFNSTPNMFYEELSDASHYFTSSLGDVISSSAIEAHLCGCYVVVPQIVDFWPCFQDYISRGYRPFDKEDVERVIREKPTYIFNCDLFDRNSVAARLITGLDL